ncbi:MAG: SatD family protein [bacterium]
MEKQKFYAAITGDIVGSTRFAKDHREKVLSTLKSSFKTVEDILPEALAAPFAIFRGDSFQGVLDRPEAALRAALIIRASLGAGFESRNLLLRMDARIAIGIGSVDFLPEGLSAEGDGEAFRLSGPALDSMKGDQRLVIRTRWPHIHAEFDTECALLDVLISKWSWEQAQAITGQMRNLTQEAAALEFGISQPAIQQRLKHAGGWAVAGFCQRYEEIIKRLINQ